MLRGCQTQLEPETTALPLGALQANPPAQFFHQMLTDCQPQAGTAIAPRHGFAGLGETVEDFRLHCFGDADTVVGDTHPHPLQALLLAQHLNLDSDLPAFGELDRVGQQVAQHLTQKLLGALLTLGQLRIDMARQGTAVGQRPGFKQGDDFVAQLTQGKNHGFGMGFAFFQTGEIQHFVEDGQQPFPSLVQGIQTLAVLHIESGAAQQFSHAENAVERRAQFMAHGRQKARFGQVRRLGLILGAHQAGGTPFDHLLQLVAFVLQGQAVHFAPLDIAENRPAHVVQRMGHGVDLI
ncbi:hypothetical protein D3C78_1043410 [compost metagenome]